MIGGQKNMIGNLLIVIYISHLILNDTGLSFDSLKFIMFRCLILNVYTRV
jgi:hypothetical protein